MAAAKRRAVTHPRRYAVVVVVGVGIIVLTFATALVLRARYADEQRTNALHDSQRQDYALCVAQNQSRQQTRRVASSTYALVAGVLKNGGPDDPELRKVFLAQNQELGDQLKALRPLDCSTYVRPDIPPDQGVD